MSTRIPAPSSGCWPGFAAGRGALGGAAGAAGVAFVAKVGPVMA